MMLFLRRRKMRRWNTPFKTPTKTSFLFMLLTLPIAIGTRRCTEGQKRAWAEASAFVTEYLRHLDDGALSSRMYFASLSRVSAAQASVATDCDKNYASS